MPRFFAPALCVAVVLSAQSALAHGVAGSRVFVNMLILDDPAVTDDAALPTISWQRPPGAAPSNAFDFNFEFDKRITDRLGVAVNDGYSL